MLFIVSIVNYLKVVLLGRAMMRFIPFRGYGKRIDVSHIDLYVGMVLLKKWKRNTTHFEEEFKR